MDEVSKGLVGIHINCSIAVLNSIGGTDEGSILIVPDLLQY